MGYSHHHHHHGRVSVGRIKVVVVCLLVVAINGWLFKRAAAPPDPLQLLEALTVISIPWILAGAWGMCVRKNWGRGLMLAVLYLGSFGCLMTWLAAMVGSSDSLRARSTPLLAGTVVYALCSIVLTKSRDVRRLTSRALE
jgi:hypothetical protein